MRLVLSSLNKTAFISCSSKFILIIFFYVLLFKEATGVRQQQRRQLEPNLDYSVQIVPSSNNACYSCASSAYLYFWNQLLMHHYFPPKNFTDRCWQPDIDIGSVPCMSACFTIVEEVYAHVSGQAVMRGCVDRLLLFGMDVDVKEAIISYDEMCRTMDRHLLQLVPLHQENPLVLMCTCTGKLCNKNDAENMLSKTTPPAFLSPILLFALALLNVFR